MPNRPEGTTKPCKQCGIEKEMTEFYGKRLVCKECIAAYMKEYRKPYEREHATVIAARKAKYYQEHKDTITAVIAKYRKEHAAETKATRIKYRKENAESIAIANAKYRKGYAPIRKELSRQWRANNKDRCRRAQRIAGYRQRAIMANIPIEQIERIDPFVVFERDKGICGICGELVERDNFQVDHVIPISRGGASMYDNVQVTHRICNQRKGARICLN
jgi:5-methylcytosine-specific restriction endonuclease McrA